MRGVLLERVLVVAELGQRRDQAVARVDLQDRLRSPTPPGRSRRAAFPASGPGRLRAATRQTALSVSRSEARTSETASPSVVFDEGEEAASRRRSLRALASSLASSSGICGEVRPRPASPTGTACRRTTAAAGPQAVDHDRTAAGPRCRGRGSLRDAGEASSWARFLAGDVIDRVLLGLQRRDIVLEAAPRLAARRWCESARAPAASSRRS